MCDGVMFFVIVRFYKERQLRYTIIHYLTMIWSNMFVYTTVDIGYSKKKKTFILLQQIFISCKKFVTPGKVYISMPKVRKASHLHKFQRRRRRNDEICTSFSAEGAETLKFA